MNIDLNPTEIRILREALAVWVMHPQMSAAGRILREELRARGVHPDHTLNEAGMVAMCDAQIDSSNREFHTRRLRQMVGAELAIDETVAVLAG